MSKQTEALKQALEALELHAKQYPHMQKGYTVDAITDLRQALANEALDKMAENARELGIQMQPAHQQEPVAAAMRTVIEAMQVDPEYAWSWHCNIAMAFVDAGGDHYTGNQGAARFMKMLANVEPAHELPSSQAQRTWVDPNDKTQKQYLPHIGEPVLFCNNGVTYMGKHTGGSFQSEVTNQYFNTWECQWMYLPAAHGIKENT